MAEDILSRGCCRRRAAALGREPACGLGHNGGRGCECCGGGSSETGRAAVGCHTPWKVMVGLDDGGGAGSGGDDANAVGWRRPRRGRHMQPLALHLSVITSAKKEAATQIPSAVAAILAVGAKLDGGNSPRCPRRRLARTATCHTGSASQARPGRRGPARPCTTASKGRRRRPPPPPRPPTRRFSPRSPWKTTGGGRPSSRHPATCSLGDVGRVRGGHADTGRPKAVPRFRSAARARRGSHTTAAGTPADTGVTGGGVDAQIGSPLPRPHPNHVASPGASFAPPDG